MWSKVLMNIILGVRKILIIFNLHYRINSLTDWQRVSFYKEYGPSGHHSINVWSTDGTFGLLSTLRNQYKTMKNMMVHAGLRNLLQCQEKFLKDKQIYFGNFFYYRKVWYINLYVHYKRNPMVSSKSLMDIILGIRKILLIPLLKKTWRFDQPLWLSLVNHWIFISSMFQFQIDNALVFSLLLVFLTYVI